MLLTYLPLAADGLALTTLVISACAFSINFSVANEILPTGACTMPALSTRYSTFPALISSTAFVTSMVTVPVFVPLAGAMEINELTLGVVYLLTMEIGLLTPPFGLLLFVMRGVAPAEIRMPQIYASVMPFLLIKIFVLALVVWLPGIGTWLPGLMGR